MSTHGSQPGIPAKTMPAQAIQGQTGKPAILPYGGVSQSSQYGAKSHDYDPMKKTVVQEVANSARNRLNQFIRDTNPDGKLYQPHESIPALLLLMEAKDFTREPKRTFALRAMKNMQVQISTNHAITTVWERSRFDFVPWEVSTVPVNVAIRLLDQVRHYIYSIDVDISVDPHSGKRIVTAKQLEADERIHVAFMKFREPTAKELAMRDDPSSRFNQSVTAVQSTTGGPAVMVNLNPGDTSHQQVMGDGAPVASSAPVAEGQVQKTSMAPDKRLQEAPSTPDNAVTDSTVSPDISQAALAEQAAAGTGTPAGSQQAAPPAEPVGQQGMPVPAGR